MKRAFLLAVVCCITSLAFSQVRIDKVERITAYPFTTVQITGDGFSSTASDLAVLFGNVKGTITASSSTSITVTVPAQARLSSVEVINVITKRSAKSSKKFIPNFSGTTFVNSFLSKSFPVGAANSDIFDLCSCDLDNDGRTDFVGTNFNQSGANLMLLVNSSTIQANNTTLNFTTSSIPLAAATIGIACGDLNGDGKPEIVVSRGDRNGFNPGNTLFILPNTSTGPGVVTFGTAIQLSTVLGDLLRDVAIHDLNNDGQPEIIATNASNNTIYIFENNLTSSTIVAGEFTRFDKVVTGNTAADATAAGTLALEVGDMNGDGWPEVIVAPNKSYMNQKVFVFVNPADGSFNYTQSFTTITTNITSQSINDIALADFNNDGQMDFVVADKGLGVDKAFVFLNRGSLVFQSVNSTTGFASPISWGVDVADMNGDGFVDFVTGNRTSPAQTNIYLSNGAATPTFTRQQITAPRVNWFVKTGDFDGDSKPDIAMTSNDAAGFGIHFLQNRNCHKPIILNEDPISICGVQTKILNAVSLQGVAYSWSTGDTGASTTIDINDVGTVTLTAVGDGGTCSVQETITVVDGGGPAVSQPTITGPNGVCAGSALTLTTNTVAGATYLWTGPNNFTASTAVPSASVSTSATVAHAGDYFLQIQVGSCTSIPSLAKNVPVIAPQSFTISGSASVCVGQLATLTVSASDYNFQWKKDGVDVGTNSGTYPIPAAAETDQGSYTVELSHQTISCTSTTTPFALNVITAPSASFTRNPTLVCVGTEVTFDATASTVDNTAPTPVYAWNFGDASNGTGVTTTHTYVAASASVPASLTISYTGVTGCTGSSSPGPFVVNAATAPSITADPVVTEICGDGSETVLLEVVGTYSNYDWTPTGPNAATFTANTHGTYSVVTTDANGCTGNAEIIFTAKPGCDPGAAGIPKVFTPNGTGPAQTETWIITGVPNLDECTMSVFDGRGRRVFEVKGFPATGWDGIANGKPVPDGTYYYVLGCPGAKPVTGSVLIVR
jgi:gliding motility-associated-like protein